MASAQVLERPEQGQPDLSQKIKDALDEARILTLGAQVLIGASYSAVLQPGYRELPFTAQLVQLSGLTLMLIVLALLLSPCPYHRIVERGEDTRRLREYVTRIAGWALLPFSLALGAELYSLTIPAVGATAAAALAALGLLLALSSWYGLELIGRWKLPAQEKLMGSQPRDERAKAELKDKIVQVLTESRVVLPGAQALLGFQFLAMVSNQFPTLPAASKFVHVGSLMAIALSTIWLMTPAAYHRIVEDGQASQRFLDFAGRMVVIALIPLALGLASDFYVVVQRVSGADWIAASLAAVLLCGFLGFWFGMTLLLRSRRPHPRLLPAA